jgi:hypothetical protein
MERGRRLCCARYSLSRPPEARMTRPYRLLWCSGHVSVLLFLAYPLAFRKKVKVIIYMMIV